MGSHAAFVYGTLRAERVLGALLGRIPSRKRAWLSGYKRYCVRECVYPAIRPAEGDAPPVDGLLLEGLSDEEVKIFDDFEDEDYEKVATWVQVEGEEGVVECFTYVWKAHLEHLLHGTWSYEEHFEPHMDWYVENAAAYAPAAKGSAEGQGGEEED